MSTQEFDLKLSQYEEAAGASVPQIGFRTLIAFIPYAGGPILEIIDGLAQRRVQERLHTVFGAMKDRLDRVEEEKIHQAFFDTEEFQTLLFLLIEKLHTTHDDEKLRMFGGALANSGTSEFKLDEKEEYIRILRDLSSKDLQALRRGGSHGFFPYGEKASSLARLISMGLVNERLEEKRAPLVPVDADRRRMAKALQEVVSKPPERTYAMSSFGWRFLKFIAAEANRVADNQT